MAEYFVDPYLKYYNNLESASSLASSVSSIGDEVTTLSNNISNLISQISASRWQELGQVEISTKILPTMEARIKSVSSDVKDVLNQAITKADELYKKVKELKESDEKLETLRSELEELKKSEPSYKSGLLNNEESSEHKSWKSKVTNKETEIKTCEEKCKLLQGEADSLAQAINGLTISDEPAEVVVEIQDPDAVNIETLNGMITYTFDGETYYVANTKLGLNEYLKIIDKQHIAQQYSSSYSGKCLGFTYIHSYDLYTGYTGHTGDDADNGSSPYSISTYQTWNKSEAIDKIVQEVSNGRPVVVQVNGSKRKNGYGRHFVTVVGIKADAVKSGKVSEKDLLILDAYDGDLRTLDTSRSKSRFMTRGADTGNGNYGYYVISMKNKNSDARKT